MSEKAAAFIAFVCSGAVFWSLFRASVWNEPLLLGLMVLMGIIHLTAARTVFFGKPLN